MKQRQTKHQQHIKLKKSCTITNDFNVLSLKGNTRVVVGGRRALTRRKAAACASAAATRAPACARAREIAEHAWRGAVIAARGVRFRARFFCTIAGRIEFQCDLIASVCCIRNYFFGKRKVEKHANEKKKKTLICICGCHWSRRSCRCIWIITH